MQQQDSSLNRNWVIFFVLMFVVLVAWTYLAEQYRPEPEKETELANRDAAAMFAGPAVLTADWADGLPGAKRVPDGVTAVRRAVRFARKARRAALAGLEPPADLLGLGWGDGDSPFELRVLLTTQGGAVQQVKLVRKEFQQADRLGRAMTVTNDDGERAARPVYLIPGAATERAARMADDDQSAPTRLKPGKSAVGLTEPSYAMYHYDDRGRRKKAGRPEGDLGAARWEVAARRNGPDDDEHSVSFRAELGAPHHVRITKTYSLKRGEYHIGLAVKVEALGGRPADAPDFRYQLGGARNTPIMGEWYTSTYRNALVGWDGIDGDDARRALISPQQVYHQAGSDKQEAGEAKLRFGGVGLQYFASVTAVDDEQEDQDFLDYMRATPEGAPPEDHKQVGDITVRAVTRPIPLKAGEAVTHKYMLYNGPIKVRLLKQLKDAETGELAIDPALVDRYTDKLHLDKMTDAPLPNFFGRFANSIYWSDLIIFSTNLMHGVLNFLNRYIPNFGLCIICLTLMVRLLLFPLSRKQAISTKRLQNAMAKMKPEMDKLKEKYGHDAQALMQARMDLYRKHNVNPLAPMGGCLMLLLQTPIFMGLYWSLNESVFFRLQDFLWIDNLAAPDMLFSWGEGIPVISDPSYLGSPLYLGPYFNLLPLLAMAAMLIQQQMLMPPAQDENQAKQQQMMKFMLPIFALIFFKVAAGVALYFVCSTAFALFERKFLIGDVDAAAAAKEQKAAAAAAKPAARTPAAPPPAAPQEPAPRGGKKGKKQRKKNKPSSPQPQAKKPPGPEKKGWFGRLQDWADQERDKKRDN